MNRILIGKIFRDSRWCGTLLPDTYSISSTGYLGVYCSWNPFRLDEPRTRTFPLMGKVRI